MPSIPTGTVALLFTDIEGSTKMWESHPAEMKSAVERHDAICRAAIETRSGYVFKTVGDAFCAAFAKASDAIAAAAAIRRELSAVEWGPTPILVRAGVHAGAAEERDGDYFGQPVNRAARISAAGSGGQILVSLAASELAKDGLPEGCSMRDLGFRRLKDLAAPERLLQLDEAGFRTDFPPLKTLDERPNNLPRALTSFFGREEEVARITGLLETAALVTLTGPGGTGKTRLALECGAALVDRFRDGVWFVDLTRIDTGSRLESEIAKSIGLQESPEAPIAEILATRLKAGQLLLIIDNCEHVVEACAEWTARALASSEGLKILATSREALLVGGETSFLVAPLPRPTAKNLSTEALSQFEAVRLFIDRARGTGKEFAIDAETAPFIAGVCERLEGMPLALELAAAQLRFMSLPELFARLEDLFGTLHSRERGTQARQATLRGLVDWSWNLLDEEERGAWRRLSVFRGGFARQAARFILGRNADRLVESLSLKSILLMDEDEAGDGRFRMLEALREYAAERLAEAGERPEADRALVAWLRSLAAEAEQELAILKGTRIYARLDAELANILSGAETAMRLGLLSDVVGILGDLSAYVFCGRVPLEAIVNLIEGLAGRRGELGLADQDRLEMLRIRKALAFIEAEEEMAEAARCIRARAIAAGDGFLEGQSGLVQVELLRIFGRFDEAIRLALDLIEAPPGPRSKATLADAAALAGACLYEGTFWRREPSLEKILKPGESLPAGIDPGLPTLAISAELKRWSLGIARELGDMSREAANSLADELCYQGDYEEARPIVERSIELKRRLGMRSELWYSLEHLAQILVMLGRREELPDLADEARKLASEISIPFLDFHADEMELSIHRCHREWGDALRVAKAMLDKMRGKAYEVVSLRLIGQCLVELGRFEEGAAELDAFFRAFVAWGWRRNPVRLASAAASRRRAELAQGGKPEEAAMAAGAALATLEDWIVRFPKRPRLPLASFSLPEGFAMRDLAEVNWGPYADECAAFEGLLADASSALGRAAFSELLLEGRRTGPRAIWNMPDEALWRAAPR